MALAMAAAWFWQQRIRNASIVDVVWTFGTGGLGVTYAMLAGGLPARRLLVGVVVCAWSLRLGLHLLARVRDHVEDERYRQMRTRWGDWAPLRFFLFFQSQAIAAPLFASPMLIAAGTTAELGLADLAGVALAIVAIGGEGLADYQLAQFRKDSQGSNQVCDVGLWRYSRHPNYFFEWFYWWSYVFLAANSPWWWLTLGPPLAMYYFLNFVTGIPPAEAQALAKRGEAYREYQRRTSAFFLWPPSST
jgi:steroid 5-alpha reductase family enzyme